MDSAGPDIEEIRRLVDPVAARSRGAGAETAPRVQPPRELPINTPAGQAPEQPAAVGDALSFVPDLETPDAAPAPVAPVAPATSTDAPKPAAAAAAVPEPDDDSDLPDDPKAENFKALRDIAKDARARNRDLIAQLEAQKAEVSKRDSTIKSYENGEAIPQILQEKDARIAELEPLERVHKWKGSQERQVKFVQPMTAAIGKLHQLATDYGIPTEVLDAAVNLSSDAELNRFLTTEVHFDDLGALDARTYIREIRGLKQALNAADEAPEQSLQAFAEETARRETETRAAQFKAMHQASRTAWVRSLERHRNDGFIHELIEDPNDAKHNRTFVIPVLTAAGQEYGKILKELHRCGLKELPDSLGDALASLCQLAHATAVASEIRRQALDYTRQVQEDAAERAYYNQPAVGAGAGVSVAAPAEPRTPDVDGRMSARASREASMAAARAQRR